MTLALSPMYLSTIPEATTFMKLALTLQAIALRFRDCVSRNYLAIKVFPVPGGPYNKTPFGGVIPTLLNNSGFVIGNSTVSLRILIWS